MRAGTSLAFLGALLWLASLAAAASTAPQVILTTTMGDVTVELDPLAAPITVANFLRYVRAGYYDGTLIHRVVRNFMVQGGGLTSTMAEKDDGRHAPIQSEAGNGRRNLTGTIAMARQSTADSATSQFFINLRDNDFLDREHALDHIGYAVFGQVVAGMEIIRQMETVPITARRGHPDVPIDPIVIRSVREIPPDPGGDHFTDTSALPRRPPATVAGRAD